MKTLLAVFAAVLLSGCAAWNTAKMTVAIHGAKVADEEFEVARWSNCEAVTAGALARKYKNDPGGFAAWREYCGKQFIGEVE